MCLLPAVREYAYIEKGGTAASSAALGVSEHAVIKTLLFMEAEDATPFVVLQHGDASVDTKKLLKELARTRGMASGVSGAGVDSTPSLKPRRMYMTSPDTAEEHTGYKVGGTSPFGLRNGSLRVFMEASLLRLLPSPAPATVEPTHSEDAATRQTEVAAWDPQVSNEQLVDFNALDTRLAKSSTLDLVSPAWVLINGGARGTLVGLSVRNIVKLLRPIVITAAKYATEGGEEAAKKPPVAAAEKEKKQNSKPDDDPAAAIASSSPEAPVTATAAAASSP
jgi:prolyl-tRNA editing enzyme YbaK/EbsC (Cys-tRNA(Pro) deacylase)